VKVKPLLQGDHSQIDLLDESQRQITLQNYFLFQIPLFPLFKTSVAESSKLTISFFHIMNNLKTKVLQESTIFSFLKSIL
jgi:hypothetical protein